MRHNQPILLIDDDDDIREMLSMMLTTTGYSVETARDGLDALEHLSAGLEPSVILVDMMMPRMDGERFVAAVRDDPRLAQIPIVMLSGHDAARSRAAALHTQGCLVKPVEIDDLLRAVERFTS